MSQTERNNIRKRTHVGPYACLTEKMKTNAEIFWSESMALGLEYSRSQGAEDYVGASD